MPVPIICLKVPCPAATNWPLWVTSLCTGTWASFNWKFRRLIIGNSKSDHLGAQGTFESVFGAACRRGDPLSVIGRRLLGLWKKGITHKKDCVRVMPVPIICLKVPLQLLMNRYGYIRVAQVSARVSTTRFVVLSIGNSKSNLLGAQGTFNTHTHIYRVNPDIYIYIHTYIYINQTYWIYYRIHRNIYTHTYICI